MHEPFVSCVHRLEDRSIQCASTGSHDAKTGNFAPQRATSNRSASHQLLKQCSSRPRANRRILFYREANIRVMFISIRTNKITRLMKSKTWIALSGSCKSFCGEPIFNYHRTTKLRQTDDLYTRVDQQTEVWLNVVCVVTKSGGPTQISGSDESVLNCPSSF